MMLLSGVLIALINYFFTGWLHLDGLADFADAFGTLHRKQRILEILKDPHTGVFGVAGIVFSVLVRIIAYHILITAHQLHWILFCLIISRIYQALLLGFLPYARGHEGKTHGYQARPAIRGLIFVELAACFSILIYREGAFKSIVPVITGTVPVFLVCWICFRRIGGITGDCVGAASELFEMLFLIGAIACLS
jgi:adenosylcobinamide-GDP ribazoletransferase